jgi:hypothetical protein
VGVGTDAPPNWREVFLDSEAAHIWGREMGWGLRGGDTKSFLDHTWSYRHPGQISLYRQVRRHGMAVPIVRTRP